MSEIRPRFYVHKQKASWIIVRMGSDHVVFGSATPSVPVWQKWDEWHDKNVEEGSWVEITYANMRPPAPPSSPRSEPRQSLQQVRLYIPMHDRVGWMMARLGDKFMMLSEWTSEFQLKDWTANEDRQVELGAFVEITYPNLRPTRELDDLKAEVKEKVRLIEDLRAELDSENLNVQTLEAKLKHNGDIIDEQAETIQYKTRSLVDRDNLIDGLRREVAGHINVTTNLRGEIDRLTTSNKALGQEVTRVTSDRNYLRGKFAGKDQTIQEMRKDLDRSIQSLREDLKGRDDTIALLNKKIVEQADQIRAMQALAGKPWTYAPTQTFAEMPRQYVCEDGKVVEAYQRTADGRTPPGEPFVFSDKDPGKQYEIEGLQGQIDELTKRFHEFRNYAIARDAQKDGLIATLAKRVQTLEEKP
jgi:hypothetical protein